MQYNPFFVEILDGIRAAYNLDNRSADFEEWLGDLACHDVLDRGDRVIKFSSELVGDVVNGFSGAFMVGGEAEQRLILRAHQFLQALDHIRDAARDWGTS